MKMVGVGDQHLHHFTFNADGQTLSVAHATLVLPQHSARSSLFLQNTGTGTLFFGFGSARATCTIAGGAITAVTITNGGFGFTNPPRIQFLGGGIMPQQGIIAANPGFVGAPGPTFPSPQHPATAHCVLTGGVVTSVVIDDPGAGYISVPQVFMQNDALDPNGAFDCGLGGVGQGSILNPSQSFSLNGPVCTTDQLSVFCTTNNAPFSCWYTT